MSDTAILAGGTPSQIQPGLVIGGKYRIEEEIGRGSMGTVYRAAHITLGQRVAIKLISGEHLQSSEARKRFSVEAKAAAKLRSRHVVQVYDDGETPDGNPYIVLEHLEGETLEQRLEREHDLPLADAVRVVVHVGRALARAHAQGIVHRDLKPPNIFLVKSDDDEVGWIAKVLDFGIAKLDNQGEKGTTQAGTVLGTPLFMSPEQVRGASSVDHRADLYSLGMCLFHMLTGDYAYYSDNYSDVLVAICTQPLPLLREKSPWIPEAIEHWFQRACAKEPLERFQSADEMSEALQAAAGDVALSRAKHKSFPEGRIAPETLVGFATPAAVILQIDTGPASLARTQKAEGVQLVGTRVVASPAIAVAVSSDTGVDGSRDTTGWTPPRRGVPPLLLGVGLGLLVVLLLALSIALVPGGAKSSASSPSVRVTVAGSAATLASPAFEAPRPMPPPEPVGPGAMAVSSVAADGPAPSERPQPKAGALKKNAAGGVRRPRSPTPVKPEPGKPSGSDLGF